MPATTAIGVASRRPSVAEHVEQVDAATRWTTSPSSARIVSQASVRIRYVTKNGAMIEQQEEVLPASAAERDPVRERVADAASASTVAIPAYSNERIELWLVGRERVRVVVPRPGEPVAVKSIGSPSRSDWWPRNPSGTTKKTASQASPGASSRYGVSPRCRWRKPIAVADRSSQAPSSFCHFVL